MRRMPFVAAFGVVLALVASFAVPTPAHAQQWRPSSKAPLQQPFPGNQWDRYRSHLPRRIVRPHLVASMATVMETEPNDTTTTANLVSLGDTVTGVIDPAGDADYFVIDVPGNTLLDFQLLAVGNFPGMLIIYDVDGTTVLDSAGTIFPSFFPVRVRTSVTTPGAYYVAVRSADGLGEGDFLYALELGIGILGPGDPTTLFAQGVGFPGNMAAGGDGDLFVVDLGFLGFGQQRLVRVDLAGNVTIFATEVAPSGVAVDGFGNILVVGFDIAQGFPLVASYTPAGQRSEFTREVTSPSAITIGPDGDVWVADCGNICPQLLRFDPLGNFKQSIALNNVPANLAFSPSGVLHFSNSFDIFRVTTTTESVISVGCCLEGIAFDEDGYLYVANGFLKVTLYSPSYELVEDPFANTDLGGPISLVFGRDATGAITSRLFAATSAGGIVEMNPTGMRAPGFRVGIDLLRVVAGTVPDGVVGAEYTARLTVESPPGAVTWTISDADLPPGLTLEGATGVISGVPEADGRYEFTVRAASDTRFGVLRLSIRVTDPELSVSTAVDGLFGVPDVLTPELERFLDLQGNQNGRFDIGDLQAFLRAQGRLPALHRLLAERAKQGRQP